jgi:hypothetical protein
MNEGKLREQRERAAQAERILNEPLILEAFDYDAANSAFLDDKHSCPENYQDPMSLNGFTQIT